MIEKLIGLLAPHQCIGCGVNNNTFCANCLSESFPGIADICALCSAITSDYRACLKCQKFSLERIYIASIYDFKVAKLIKKYKFDQMREAHKSLAQALDGVVSYLPPDTHVVCVPTALNHIRQRGFDHATLLAKHFAKIRRLQFITPLFRATDLHQVGADKNLRIQQAKESIKIKNNTEVKGKNFLIIDDVCTTGSSLIAATQALKHGGALRVEAAVIAWQAPNKKDQQN